MQRSLCARPIKLSLLLITATMGAGLAIRFLRFGRQPVAVKYGGSMLGFFATRPVAEVRSDLVAEYVDHRLREKAQNANISREMAALKRMFRIGMCSTPPKVLRLQKFPKPDEDNVRKGFLEDAQYEKLIGSCPDAWFRTLVEMGRTYGWRISELIKLKVKHVNVNARIIRLKPGTTKNKNGREVTMSTAVSARCGFHAVRWRARPGFSRHSGHGR